MGAPRRCGPRPAGARALLALLAGAQAFQLPVRQQTADSVAADVAPEPLRFPDAFTFGAATSAYQIEGGAAEGGRAPSVWDTFAHGLPGSLVSAPGDVADDHYHRFRDDVEIMARLGLQAYRFSISWSRVMPRGVGEVNEEGIRFYSDLIDALHERGIEPWVTISHWDLPAALVEEFGGWLGPKERITAAFGQYARTLFSRFGGRVRRWITLNEPWVVASMFGMGFPSVRRGPARDPYTAVHNQLLAHAEAARIYHEEFQAQQGGVIGITLNCDWTAPLNASSPEDVEAAQRSRDFQLGIFADPIYLGSYPAAVRSTVGSRLPEFTAAERAALQNSSDFFGVNNYFTKYATAAAPPAVPSFVGDPAVQLSQDPSWQKGDQGWPMTPAGFGELLLYIQRRYAPRGGIAVTENGVAGESEASREADEAVAGHIHPKPFNVSARPHEDWDAETEEDPRRVAFLQAYLSALHGAMDQGADVRAYFAWSLLDNLEWQTYKTRFGLVRVDYDTQKRTIKRSGRVYADIIQRHAVNATVV